MPSPRPITVEFQVAGRCFQLSVMEYTDASAIAKVKAVVMALASSGEFKDAELFEVVGGFEEDYQP